MVVLALVGAFADANHIGAQDSRAYERCDNPNARYEIAWATFLGGPGRDWLNKIVMLPDSSLMVGGWATKDGMPTTVGVVQPHYRAPEDPKSTPPGDFFLAHLSTSGEMLAATYFGGSNMEYQLGLAVDRQGNVIVSGETRSSDLPATPGSVRPTFGGTVDCFAAKLTADLRRVLWCTYLGGPGWDGTGGSDPILDAEDNVIMVGDCESGFPQMTPDSRHALSPRTDVDIFVAKLSADGSRLLSCARFGGEGQDSAWGAAMLGDGSMILTGITNSRDFPWPEKTTRVGVLGGTDAFIARLSADGSALDAMTLFGGSSDDSARCPVIARDGSVFVIGGTWSSDFPTTLGAYQRPAGEVIDDGFIVGLAAPGAGLRFAATLRGQDDRVTLARGRIGPDSLLWVGGTTCSATLSPTGDALHFYAGGSSDGLLAAFAADGSRPEFLTFLGGVDKDTITDFVFGPGGEIYVVGSTDSRDFPVTPGAIQQKPSGREDGYVLKLVPRRPVAPETRSSRR